MLEFNDTYSEFIAVVSFEVRKTLGFIPDALTKQVDKTALMDCVDKACYAFARASGQNTARFEMKINYNLEDLHDITVVVINGMYHEKSPFITED